MLGLSSSLIVFSGRVPALSVYLKRVSDRIVFSSRVHSAFTEAHELLAVGDFTNPTFINQQVVNDSGALWFYGTRGSKSDGIQDRQAGFALYAPHGYIDGDWRGTELAV